MILLKVGSNPKNDIVLNSPYVSAVHAEISVNDDGSVIIEDKASSNGTKVNKQPIKPNSPTPAKRGDLVEFGDTTLNWSKVPLLPDSSKYERIINIGSNLNSDIAVTNQFVSRHHAILYIAKDGKVYIYDHNSKNGTEINGNKIPLKKQVRVKRGDNVTVGGVDITDQIKDYIPNPFKWVKILAACLLGVIILGAAWAFIPGLFKPANKPLDMTEVQKAVVLVHGQYTMYVKLKDNPIQQSIWEAVLEKNNVKYPYGLLPLSKSTSFYTGTAFFLDHAGRLATNRHVAVPWEVADEEEQRGWKTAAEQFIHEQLPTLVHNEETEYMYTLSNSILWQMVYYQTLMEREDVRYTNSLIRQLQTAKWEVVGELDYFGIAYPGRHYDGIDELARCTLLDVSENPEIDLALIQLNDTTRMPALNWVFSPDKFNTAALVPQKDKLTWIGYPNGMAWARDPKIHQLRPQVRETTCSSTPSKYFFDIQGEILGGASGSPVFETESGALVGVAFSRLVDGTTYGRAMQAKYLKEMYNKEVGQ